ncbi:MAG: M48 family metallopeptidase [Desulfofustis sp.]
MIYTNLLIFISAIFLFSLDSVGETSDISFIGSLAIYAATLAAFWLLVKRVFSSSAASLPEGYFGAEKKLMITALFFFSIALFFADLKFFLSYLSFNQRFPAFTSMAGLLIFFSYLVLIWIGAHKNYTAVFHKQHSAATFVLNNIKLNLPIVLPWVALSLMYDLLALAPWKIITKLLDSHWGDLLFLGLFLLLVLMFLPPLVRRLWGCTELPEGPLKEHLTAFCRKQNFAAELYIWPLYEGRIITAGVLGLLPGLRYIMLTPALIQNLDLGELEAVMAHEIGHVKYRHLLLYVLLIAGFSLFAGFLAEPILYLSLSMDWLYALMARDLVSADTIVTLAGGLPLLVLLLFYFRFVFGYFIRNFERQADIYVIKVLGSSRQLISAFNKILVASGQSGDKPNWHHFGIGERIAHLELCEKVPSWITRQDRKIRQSLIVYAAVLIGAVFLINQIPVEQMSRSYEGKYIETVLMPKIRGTSDEAAWYRLLGPEQPRLAAADQRQAGNQRSSAGTRLGSRCRPHRAAAARPGYAGDSVLGQWQC